MRISRIVIRNFRSFAHLDVTLGKGPTCVIGENNTGKSNLLHAIRLCLDVNLSSSYRALTPRDVHSAVDLSRPEQVLVSLEFVEFSGKVNEEALVGAWQTSPDVARLIYRFRPKLSVREDLEAGELAPGALRLADYQWELVGGGDPLVDAASVAWDEDVGSSIRYADLQSFLVVHLPALRDVESDLRQPRSSPLARLIQASEVDVSEQESLLKALREANEAIAGSKTVDTLAGALDRAFKAVAGPAFSMEVRLGLAEPSFQSLARAFRILLTNTAMTSFDPAANGLGLNNILYISILIQYFRERLEQKKTSGQIILFEEPEAHLHPQLQLALFNALVALPFQVILTTHSTHVTAQARLGAFLTLTNVGAAGMASATPAAHTALAPADVQDLERYLDATKSSLLFARKVMLVEGPAELFLIPALVRRLKHIDLDREGVSVIPIYGVHFAVYAKLFSTACLPKRCAIVADGDLKPSDASPGEDDGEDQLVGPPSLASLEGSYVKVFANKTTFERALTLPGNLEMLALAADEIGARKAGAQLREGRVALAEPSITPEQRKDLLSVLKGTTLATAKRFGKARFAQIAARHVERATQLPKYLDDAVAWLLGP
jgi:putative ATP-dependent endonuclease of OLD family